MIGSGMSPRRSNPRSKQNSITPNEPVTSSPVESSEPKVNKNHKSPTNSPTALKNSELLRKIKNI
jgi:hypothetical protein